MKNLLTTLLVLVSCVASINAQSSKQDSFPSLLSNCLLESIVLIQLTGFVYTIDATINQ